MESKAKAFGHPVHPMLIVLPVGLFVMAVVCDILYLFTQNTVFATVAFINIAGGIIGGLLAAIFGLIDYLSIPVGTRAKNVATAHGIGNGVVMVLFAISWFIRSGDEANISSTLAMIFSFAGMIVAAVTAWLGGELVDRLGVGVDQGANLDAPSSLTGKPAEVMRGQMPAKTHPAAPVPVTGENRPGIEGSPRASHELIHEADLEVVDPMDPNAEGRTMDEP